MTRQLHLIGYCIAGPTWHHSGSWRHPDSDAAAALTPERYEAIARILEAGKFDGLFFVDVLTLFDTYAGSYDAVVRGAGQLWLLDPLQVLVAMARVTEHLGLAATVSTSFQHPFQIARSLATLDHLSKGRAGWNIVTSANDREAQNFGLPGLLDKSQRYDQADEVLEVCNKLWNSWDADAIVFDQARGVYADPAKIHAANHEGRYVKTRGPLPTPRSPQGSPVIMQAGSSPRGREFAARWAELIFTLQHEKTDMQAFYRDIKERVVRAGRRPEQCLVMPAIDIVVEETETQARDKAAEINALVSDEVGVTEISNHIGIDLSGYPLDQPLADMDITQGARGVFDVILRGSKAGNLCLRDAGRAYGTSQMTPQLIGDPRQVADELQDYFESFCCDGFVLAPSLTPHGYAQFVTLVVPELQRRGIYRKDYSGRTFRENLQG